jgi:hypothetical protein
MKEKYELMWCSDYFFDHSITSKQGISFTQPAEFKRFYKICSKIIREEDFRFELEDISKKSTLVKWSKLCKQSITVVKQVQGNVNMPNGKLVLSIRHPEEAMAAKLVTDSNSVTPKPKQYKDLKQYTAFKRIKNFVTLHVLPQ